MKKKIIAGILSFLTLLGVMAMIPVSPASAASYDCRIPSKTGHYLYRATPSHVYSLRPRLEITEGCVEVHISDTGRYWRWDAYIMWTKKHADGEKTCYVWDTPGNGFIPVERMCDRHFNNNYNRHISGFDRLIHGDPNEFRHFGVQYDRWGYSREWHEINDYYYAWNQ